jgi:hypothetical protein
MPAQRPQIPVELAAMKRPIPARRWWRPWDAVGVDAAIIVSTFNLYRYDPSYTLKVASDPRGQRNL